jgi:hypothetical protein
MLGTLADLAGELVGLGLDWLWGGKGARGEPQPHPIPETLYEERRPPPDTGTMR